MKNYKEKYKQSLEKCKKEFNLNNLEYSNLTYSHEQVKQKLEHIFPELKEIEKSKIIDALKIAVCSYCSPNHNYVNTIPKGRLIDWIEKQGEQKLDDKVESKFKVGDWVVLEDSLSIYKIVKVCKSWYEVISNNDGMQYSIGFGDEDDCRLWTIKDARDGDVLASDNGIIILVKESRNSSWGYRLSYHCAVLHDGIFEDREFHVESERFFPATKEQRDILFQKIKEAGYKWDNNKKELIRYKQ